MRWAKASITLILSIAFVSGCEASVKTGLDNISSHKHLFYGKRIGIITNHTAYNNEGQHIVDIFKNMGNVTISALFSPEHGLYGTEQAGRKIDSGIESVHELPVYSLYGNTRKPTRQMLKNIDVLVFDIQDIGARFYTYIYTMSLAMEAAAESGIRFVVLDRPNPINGLEVEGNILEPKLASFVGLHKIPIRHGMTVGELAGMFNGERWLAGGVKADLVVVPMKGWRRRMWYDQTRLLFRRPSPNMPDLETATVYPGLCLLEGTNISEGRGTATPFRQFGAPWIVPENLTARLNKLNLPGVRFEPVSFTPSRSKYQKQKCHGVKVIVTKRDSLKPFWSGVLIINEIYRMYPDAFQWKVAHFDRLCGTSAIREAITTQSSLEKVRGSWKAGLRTFLQSRKKYLIYPN